MEIKNITYYRDQPFEDYLQMGGTSYSMLNDKPVTPTPAMRLGTRVHNYINEPKSYDWVDADMVIPIATAIRKTLGTAINAFEKEVGFTADFIHNGLVMKYRGRADMLYIGNMVIDLKILAGSIEPYIKLFGYDRQIAGYCLPNRCSRGMIMAYNKKKKEVEIKVITVTREHTEFWQYQTVSRGVPLN